MFSPPIWIFKMKLLDYPVKKGYVLDATSDNHFFDCDSESLFKQNLKKMPLNWPWRTKKIQYHLNSQFYRAPEWYDVDWKNSYLIFGCSHTFGVGINYKDTYIHHLSDLLGYPTINLGVCGSSCTFQWSNTLKLVKNNVKPKGVFYLWPGITRMTTLKEDGGTFFHGPWDKQDLDKFWMNNIEHCIEFTNHLIDSVDLMWDCPTHHFHLVKDVCKKIPKLNFIQTENQPVLESARDCNNGYLHPGPKCHLDWADQMFNVITRI